AVNAGQYTEAQLQSLRQRLQTARFGLPGNEEGAETVIDPPTGTGISVIIPTRDERGNIAVLVDRVVRALEGRNAELIFVDDSSDNTPEAIAHAALHSRVPIRCIHRHAGERIGGLGGAVVEGLRAASAPVAVVMDGDLQHPPEVIPELVQSLELGEADLVVASRYNGSGRSEGLSNWIRTAVSRTTTLATRALFPRRLREVSDPMSGFFAVRIGSLDLGDLRPLGFKILLEIVSRARLRTHEVGFSFAARHSGDSKAGLREGLRFLHHLVRLRLSTLLTAKRLRAIRFGLVGATGIAVNSAAFWAIDSRLQAHYLLAAALATQVSTSWNFIGTELYVFPDAKRGPVWRRYLGFSAVNNSVMLARLPLIVLLVNSLSTPKTLANAVTLVAAFLVRFVVSDRFIYEGEQHVSTVIADHRRVGPVDLAVAMSEPVPSIRPAFRSDEETFAHRYSIHDIVRIGSDVVLPELEYFRVGAEATRTADGTAPDITVRLGRLGGFRRRARLVRSDDSRQVSWEEHLGPLSANFGVEFGDPIRVTTSRALARSPHVLYTNVLEPLLRFVFVHRGYMLLHSACLEIDGQGVMISARTDTGKTGTVLRLLRNNGGRFLSDDMTIIDGEGIARSFPKPLTISQHTLRSVNAGDLSRLEWLRLRLQSRLHSKEGRAFAMKLADRNVPIMTINGWVQRLVPPPKYSVQRLVPCDLASATSISQLFIIERGIPHQSVVPQAQAIAELLENTEDAYGFPPYRYLAPVLAVGGMDYQTLREKERLVLISAMEAVEVQRLGSSDFTWGERIIDLTLIETGWDHRGLETIRPVSGMGI
ncbi:MAG TPA: glycosyltransferase, partial [Acidimicrobiales bacterium]|nr:glycosyltransferase [Acidimicrobiales bacterium]